MAKQPQELKWIEDLLPEDDFRRKSMFGGFTYYISEKLVLAIFESTGNRTYKGQTFPFEIWNGCMFPVEKEHQEKALKKFPFLVNHPILPKWLYLPLEIEDFEELASKVVAQAIKPTGYWGTIPKPKSKKNSKKASKKNPKKEADGKIDTRRPRMFS